MEQILPGSLFAGFLNGRMKFTPLGRLLLELDMSRPAEDAPKGRKSWTTRKVERIPTTEEERAALLASNDPMAVLRKMKPELWNRSPS